MPWLIAIIFLLGYEALALIFDWTTLSRMVYEASHAWPLLPFLAGLVIGGLAVHFWWHWCPTFTPPSPPKEGGEGR